MFPSNAVSRVKLKRDLFKVENKLEPNKRRWAGPKTVSGLNSSAERVAHVQDQDSLPENAIDVKTTEEISCAPEPSASDFHGQVGSSSFTGHIRDTSEHDGGQTVNNKGILPSRVSVVSNGRITRSQGPRTRSQSASKHGKASRQFAEHKQEICYRVRLALCFGGKKQNGGKRAKNRQAKARGRALSYINSDVSVKSSNISIKSTVRAKHGAGSVEKTPEIHLNPKYAQSTGLRIVGPDTLGSEKPRPRRGRPRQIFVHSFGESKAQVKTTIKTEVRRAQTPQSLKSKTRRARSGRPVVPGTDISSKVELRRCLRSGTRLSSRKDLKRLVKNSCCALCGDIKYSPVHSKNQARLHKHKSRPVRTSQTAWREGAIDVLKSPQPPTTPIFLFEKYPLVRLCDVAQVFDIASRDFSCVLPAALRRKGKCKRVRCLMKDFRFLMHPQLLDVKKHRSKIAKQCWEVSTPTNSCASFSSGDHSQGTSDSKCIYVTEKTQDGCVKDWDGYLARNPGCKRMRNNDNEGTPSVLPQCAQAPEKACLIQNSSERCEDTSSPVHRVPPIILRRVTASSSFAVQGEDEGENSGVSLDEDGEEMRTNEDSESKMNSPESFSCQRTKAYIFFRPASCARTYKSWPFPRWGPPIELKSLLRTGPRWIVTTLSAETTKHVTQDSLGKSPECLLDNKVQNKHFRPLKQSRLASLEHTSQDLVEGLNGSKNLMSQDIHMLKLTEHIGCSAATRESLRVQVLLSEKCHKKPIVMLESLERTEGVEEHLNIPGSMLNHDHKISKPAELKSNQSEKEAFGDSHNVTEFSAFAMTDQNANWKPIHLCHAASLEESSHKSQLLKNHSLFNTPNQKSLSPGSKNQHMSVIRRDDKKTLVKTSETRCALNPEFTQISKPPLSRASSDMSLDSQGETESDIGLLSFYNPESLSELCLKSGLLKAQHSSSMAICSTREQDASDVVSGTQNAVAPTLKNDPSSAGESKQERLLDRFTNTDSSSSEDENDRGSESSDKDSAEQDESESLRSDDVMCQINEKGSAPPHSSESNVLANSFLDVCRAYEEDALVLDVIQDDPELFGAVETVKKQAMLTKENKTMHVKTKGQTRNHCKIVWDLKENSRTSVLTGAAIKKEEVEASGSLTVQDTPSYKAQLAHGINCQQVTPFINSESATDSNNNPEMNTDSVNYITVINTGAARLVLDSFNNERLSTVKETSALRTSSNYCWYYFSEHHTCLRSACWFQHTLRDGDEELCMETVKKFCHVGNHAIVLRAVEVFVGYYNSNAPGVSFSQETVNSLLLYLLNLVLLKEFVMVVNLLLKYKRLPPPEIVLALFKHVTERGLIGSIPEIIVLTSKIVEAGCVFSVDQCEVMQSHLQMMQVPREQMDIFLAVKCRALATNPHTAGLSDLAQAVVRVEMLKHQEDWTGLGQVFCGVCVGSHSPSEFTRFCCCVTMALLKEPKDKLSLPYEQFAVSVCQQVSADSMVKNILGRIGVSLIFRYHRTREWNKGVKLVNVMFRLHIEFTTLKGLMGNEHRVSRCHLVTTATELFLHSGSIEGALKLLRADDWFVSSDIWPCEQTDIETRRHVLTLLAGKTSHRDTFDILTNLPGLKQPINGVQVDEYTEMFNAHLRLCVMKQTLPVAADILEFMLMQGMVPESIQLQNLIHKLGKQNNWSRARGLFKRARSAGFYAAVVCEKDSLFLPCSLTEIEMTLAFEMFITSIKTSLQPPAGSSQPLLITLRRRTDVEDVTESVYLAAGCRLLSAALIPNPKLNIRYTAVNQNQEQLFQLDRGSAHKWLLQNKRWAQEIWAS